MTTKKENPAGANGLGRSKKTKLHQQHTRNQSVCQSTATAAQRARIFEHLQHEPLTTLQARAQGIMHPGMRICELRKQGHDIRMEWTQDYCPGGVLHRVARYRLGPARQLNLVDLLARLDEVPR